MTEPASLLPVARFNCHRLVLLGDPNVRYTVTHICVPHAFLLFANVRDPHTSSYLSVAIIFFVLH
jgi:hypothetical protein